jgi:hypothetical protein
MSAWVWEKSIAIFVCGVVACIAAADLANAEVVSRGNTFCSHLEILDDVQPRNVVLVSACADAGDHSMALQLPMSDSLELTHSCHVNSAWSIGIMDHASGNGASRELTSASTIPVPEPGAVFLLAIAVLCVLMWNCWASELASMMKPKRQQH